MATVAVIASAAAALVGGYSAYQQGQARAEIAAYNATVAAQNAELTAEQAAIKQKEKNIVAARQARQAKRVLAAQKVGFAKAGVQQVGTPLAVAAETEFEAQLDALAIKYASTVEQSELLARESAFRQQSVLEKMRGRQAKVAGAIGAGTSLLTGVGRAAYYKR